MDFSEQIIADLSLQDLVTRDEPWQKPSSSVQYSRAFFMLNHPHRLVAKLCYEFDTQNALCTIGYIRRWTGKNIGRTILQRLAHEALTHEIPRIEIHDVIDGGFSFWPRMGATLKMMPTQLCAAFDTVRPLSTHPYLPFNLPDNAVQMARAEDDLKSGIPVDQVWFGLSENPEHGGLTRQCLAAVTNELTRSNRFRMTLDLTDPRVLTRIGVVPPAL